LFSGAGGFDLGFEAAGFEVAWQVEVDRDCVSVLARHWPGATRYGDVREVDPERDLTPVDVVVFGSPCQGFSVAGKRGGFADERSGLFGEAVRIIRGLRPGPAVVSGRTCPERFTTGERESDDPERDVRGRDFAAVLAALANLGALDIAWRVVDSQGVGDLCPAPRAIRVLGRAPATTSDLPCRGFWRPNAPRNTGSRRPPVAASSTAPQSAARSSTALLKVALESIAVRLPPKAATGPADPST
jgi:DNA (cytosine-5)-methyltransferase 1